MPPLFELSPYHVALVAFGLVVILAYWLPRFVSGREPAASALLIALGIALSFALPDVARRVDPLTRPGLWERASEVALIVSLFGTGLRIDRLVDWTGWRPAAGLLAITMPLSIAAVAAIGGLAGMTLAGALLLGAVLAPTDPVLASDVQVGPPLEGGEHPVRFALTAEAGLNDGLAFPFVHLALALGAAGAINAGLIGHWLWLDVAYRTGVGALMGIAVGWLLGRLLFDLPRANPLANTQVGVVAIAGLLLCYGVTELVEGYGFVACFLAGLTLRRSEARHEFHRRLHGFTETIEHTMTAGLLVAIGLALPALWPSLTWVQAAIGAASLFVVRPIAGWIALAGAGFGRRQRMVVSFYGVRGIGSIYYVAYAAGELKLVDQAPLWSTVAITILFSTVIHGLTAGLAVERVTSVAPGEV